MSQPLETTAPAEDQLHILGRLSRSFPQKAAKRAVLAFCTPPRLPAPPFTPGLEPEILKSREGLHVLRWADPLQTGLVKKVLLVHGWGLQGASMASFAEPLLSQGFQVYAFDGPAHGQSPGVRTTGADFVKAVLALSDEYGPFAGAVGHSVGGAAVSIAMGKGAAINKAALLAPAFLPEIVDSFAGQVDLTEEVKSIFLELLEVETQSALADWSSHNLASEVKQPIIIFHDPLDGQVSIDHSRTYAKMASDAALHEMPEAGHNRIVENKEVVDNILQFFAAA